MATPKKNVTSYTSQITVITSSGESYNISRDGDGDYMIVGPNETMMLGDSVVARSIANELGGLIDLND